MPTSDLSFDFSLMSLREKEKDLSVAEANAEKQGLFVFGSNTIPAAPSSPRTISQSASRQTNKLSSNHQAARKSKTEPGSEGHAERLAISPAPSLGYILLGLINGLYGISCTNVREKRGSTQPNIILFLDTTRVWATYDFGHYFGIFL
jgi:hypothetical protein